MSDENWPDQSLFHAVEETPEKLTEFKTIHLTIQKDQSELIKGKWFKAKKPNQQSFQFLTAYGEWKE